MSHPNVEFMREYFSAWMTGDLDTVRASFNDDLEVHLAGKSSFAGVYRGIDNFFNDYVQRVYALTKGNAQVVRIKDILANDERAVVLAEERFERPGKVLDVNRFLIYEIRAGKISQIWEFEDDLHAVDEFFEDDPGK
ncbi:MAG: nuclear transport factor 2 family protein [Phycisphaerales bacterium]|nr:MAG: nuclear transport factor 2 family protein [Phycisphaerales bacterium]